MFLNFWPGNVDSEKTGSQSSPKLGFTNGIVIKCLLHDYLGNVQKCILWPLAALNFTPPPLPFSGPVILSFFWSSLLMFFCVSTIDWMRSWLKVVAIFYKWEWVEFTGGGPFLARTFFEPLFFLRGGGGGGGLWQLNCGRGEGLLGVIFITLSFQRRL